MRREPSTTARLSARVDALIRDLSEHGLVAGGQVMRDVKLAELVLLQLVDQLGVQAVEVLRGEVEGVGVGEQGAELEHVRLVVEQLPLDLGVSLGGELPSHDRVPPCNGQGCS